jgi:hypothetical protein
MLSTYNLFISHSWSYSDMYIQLIKKLRERPYFNFKDFSVPKDDPIFTNGTNQQLYDAFYRQMNSTHIVIVLAGVWASYSKSITTEIDIAKRAFSFPKPILAIEPWGAERTSKYVKDNADLIVKWQTESIVEAIRKISR